MRASPFVFESSPDLVLGLLGRRVRCRRPPGSPEDRDEQAEGDHGNAGNLIEAVHSVAPHHAGPSGKESVDDEVRTAFDPTQRRGRRPGVSGLPTTQSPLDSPFLVPKIVAGLESRRKPSRVPIGGGSGWSRARLLLRSSIRHRGGSGHQGACVSRWRGGLTRERLHRIE